MWSAEVRKRIRDTYMYFGGSVGITALSALAVSRSPRLMSIMMKNSWMVCCIRIFILQSLHLLYNTVKPV